MGRGTNKVNVEIRRANLGDVETIIEFNQALASETEGRQLNSGLLHDGVRAAVEDQSKCMYFVAECDEQVAGQLMITFEWSDWRNGWFWWIQSVYVSHEHRQRGIFRKLYEHVRAAGQAADDCCGIRLYVEKDNDVAQNAYSNLGMASPGYLVLEEDWAS